MFFEIFDKFYEVTENKILCARRMIWVPVLYTHSKSEILQAEFDEENNIKGFKKLSSHSFTSRSHGPIIGPINLEINEELVFIKAKKRPAVILCQCADENIWNLMQKRRTLQKDLRFGKLWLILPIYSVHDDYPEEFKILLNSLYFIHFFPIKGNNACPEKDSFCRLDKVCAVHMSLIESTNFLITEEIFETIKQCFIYYILGKKVGDEYFYYRSEFLKKLGEYLKISSNVNE